MSTNKTVPTKASVSDYMASITDAQQKADAKKVSAMMRAATGRRARMWGASLVGFGQYHYRYDSGREGDFMLTGFSARKRNLVVYIMPGFDEFKSLMKKLGKYKTGKSCLYINKLDDVDEQILARLIDQSVRWMRKKYPDAT